MEEREIIPVRWRWTPGSGWNAKTLTGPVLHTNTHTHTLPDGLTGCLLSLVRRLGFAELHAGQTGTRTLTLGRDGFPGQAALELQLTLENTQEPKHLWSI